MNAKKVKNSISFTQKQQKQDEIPDLSRFDQSPNSKFFDIINQKTLKMKLFYKWKFLFYYRNSHSIRAVSQSYDDMEDNNDFNSKDQPLISPEKDEEAIRYLYTYSRIKRKKYLISKYRVKAIYFHKWIEKYVQQKNENLNSQIKYGNMSQTEVFGQLHAMIEKNAKAEADLETLDGKINDLMVVIQEAEEKVNKTRDRHSAAIDEQQRQESIQEETISKYEDVIASLKMQITVSQDKRDEKLTELRNRLRLTKQAKGIQSENNDESMDAINNKIRKIKEELQKKKVIALQARAACLANKKQCDDLSKEITEVSELREDLAGEVDKLEIQLSKIANGTMDDLRRQKESADTQLMDMRSKIQRNEAIKEKLTDKMQSLIIERNATRKMLESAERAFSADIDDEEEEED